MNKKGQLGQLGVIIMIFVAIILGLALSTQIFNTQNLVTEKQDVTDEEQSLTTCYTSDNQVNESNSDCNITVNSWYPTGDWRASETQCNIGSVVVTNSTGGLTLIEGTDYNLFAGSGLLQFLNTTNTDSLAENLTLSDYNYCGEGYNKDASSRGIAGLWGLFAAFIILGATFYGIREWLNK